MVSILWETDCSHCWEIRPPVDDSGIKPPSRRITADQFFSKYAKPEECFHFGYKIPDRVSRATRPHVGSSRTDLYGGTQTGWRTRAHAMSKRRPPPPAVELWLCDTGSGVDVVNRYELGRLHRHVRSKAEAEQICTVGGEATVEEEVKLFIDELNHSSMAFVLD